jgi:membrane associated rhomboid family serine protease
MIAAWQAILLINGVEQLLRRERAMCSLLNLQDAPGLLPSQVYTSFSGGAVDAGNYHVFVTASFCHASRSHFINNMIMLAAIGPQLEDRLGFVSFFVTYILAGVAGWLCTFLRVKALCTESWMWDTYKWQESVGASPSTYGLAIAAACLLDPSHAVGPAFGPGVSTEEASAAISWLTTVLAVFILPGLLGGNSFKVVFEPEQPLALLGLLLHIINYAYFLAPAAQIPFLSPVAINACSWLALYHFKTFSKSLYIFLLKTNQFQQADHASHFGGSVIGLGAAMLTSGTAANCTPIGVSLAYVTVRFIFDI